MGEPSWMYRRGEDGKIESRLFEADEPIPGDWCESPALAPGPLDEVIPAAPEPEPPSPATLGQPDPVQITIDVPRVKRKPKVTRRKPK